MASIMSFFRRQFSPSYSEATKIAVPLGEVPPSQSVSPLTRAESERAWVLFLLTGYPSQRRNFNELAAAQPLKPAPAAPTTRVPTAIIRDSSPNKERLPISDPYRSWTLCLLTGYCPRQSVK